MSNSEQKLYEKQVKSIDTAMRNDVQYLYSKLHKADKKPSLKTQSNKQIKV